MNSKLRTANYQLGLIGLATMGANLARNIASHKFPIIVFNRTPNKTDEFIKNFGNEYLTGAHDLKNFIKKINRPRKIIILVQAGHPVDEVIKQLIPLLDPDDLIIDCGNSLFKDTIRRAAELKTHQLNFMGCGVSGGEEGALKGPSLMPGGTKADYAKMRPIFEAIAAKDFQNQPCVTHVGEDGAGHYVKMVHNGIEYGVMQIMAETYGILRKVYHLSAPQIADIFTDFNQGKLKSYLFEIAVHVLKQPDEFKDGYLVDYILDKAGQKGTGSWTAIDALERGVALPTITEAVFTRQISNQRELRIKLDKIYNHASHGQLTVATDLKPLQKKLADALYAALLSTYAQGYALIQKAAKEQNWHIDLAEISRIWQGGCIIRADILKILHEAYKNHQNPEHLFAIPAIAAELKKIIPDLSKIVAFASKKLIPVAGLSASLSYFTGMINPLSSANFIQGLRDYFGAHTYERLDRTGTFHTHWN